ncbi:MAG TPA: phosphatidate cytidylyltransferase [Candidatus Micrarchaeia archaeon]|nr:phosphatidate cytidylyltransferase [Candidatus Micrarchaeia archaeon]
MALLRRTASGVLLAGLVVAAALLGGPPLLALASLALVIGLAEFRRLGTSLGAAPPWWLMGPLAGLWLLRAAIPGGAATEIGLGLALVPGLPCALLWSRGARPFAPWATAVGGALWLGYGLGFLVLLARAPGAGQVGGWLVLLVVGVAVVSDTAAYLVGSAVGRRPFFPAISPRKTVEGALAGLAAAVVLVAWVLPLLRPSVPVAAAGLCGVLAGVASQAGDLVESTLKRAAGVKDAGGWIPGHGGLLDRLDSVVLVGPAVYSVLRALHAL